MPFKAGIQGYAVGSTQKSELKYTKNTKQKSTDIPTWNTPAWTPWSILTFCRAFTATECIETQWALAGHHLKELSVQEFISCSKPDGCAGGQTYAALSWLQHMVRHASMARIKRTPRQNEDRHIVVATLCPMMSRARGKTSQHSEKLARFSNVAATMCLRFAGS